MLIDARTLESGPDLTCDICIMGGGPAGLTLARELVGAPVKVCVLESGGLYFEEETQALARGDVVGHRYPSPDISRLRILGGASNHWEGNCSPLGVEDFRRRDWVPYSGWPFTRADLDPYYARAQVYCQLGPYTYDPRYWAERTGGTLLSEGSEKLETGVAQFSPPTNFGDVYGPELEDAANIEVYLHTNVVEIEASPLGERIERVRCRVIEGPEFAVSAKVFVLAMGGIENARMLLVSDRVHARGLGNRNDLVGRFFMDHPTVKGAALMPSRPIDTSFYDGTIGAEQAVTGFLQLAPEVVRERKLMNIRVPLFAVTNYYLSEGIASMHQLQDALDRRDWPDRFWGHVANVITDFDMVLEGIARQAFNKRLFDSADAIGGYLFDTMIEQTPDPESRITLSGKRDRFGVRQVQIDWKLAKRDQDNLWAVYRILAAELGRLKVGRVKLFEDNARLFEERLGYGHHHMGTTRAHDSPSAGVVDADLKVHDLHNLYVAGSSVFPTGGHVPPTLTIVALSIRLADHLKAMGSRS